MAAWSTLEYGNYNGFSFAISRAQRHPERSAMEDEEKSGTLSQGGQHIVLERIFAQIAAVLRFISFSNNRTEMCEV